MSGFISEAEFRYALVKLVLKELNFDIDEAHPAWDEMSRIVLAQAAEVKRVRGDMNYRIIAGRLKLKLEPILATMREEAKLQKARESRPKRVPLVRLKRRR